MEKVYDRYTDSCSNEPIYRACDSSSHTRGRPESRQKKSTNVKAAGTIMNPSEVSIR